jgi:hypothetical protein
MSESVEVRDHKELDDETFDRFRFSGADGDQIESSLNFSLRAIENGRCQPLEAAFSLVDIATKMVLERLGGWLYSQVETRTMVDPRTNVTVRVKSKSATEARKESTILRLVAKPLRMLSEYLITIAVTSPPNT